MLCALKGPADPWEGKGVCHWADRVRRYPTDCGDHFCSSVEVALISEVVDCCWLPAGCHWKTASRMILVVTEAI
jgi:hypothetical protein